jgi:DNA-binding phage protein
MSARKAPSIEDVLRKAIKDHGVYAVAQGSGVNNGVLYRFVNRERGISLKTAAALCQHLGLRLVKG